MEGKFLFIVNSGEHRQAVDIEICTSEGVECTNQEDAPFGHTACRHEQKKQKKLDTVSDRTVAKVLDAYQSMLMPRQKYSTYKLYAVTGLGHQVFLNAEN